MDFLNLPDYSAFLGWDFHTVGLKEWIGFAERAQAPYLATELRGHPIVWIPAADGNWYGFLFNFGLQPGRWYWWVPRLEQTQEDAVGNLPHPWKTRPLSCELNFK